MKLDNLGIDYYTEVRQGEKIAMKYSHTDFVYTQRRF